MHFLLKLGYNKKMSFRLLEERSDEEKISRDGDDLRRMFGMRGKGGEKLAGGRGSKRELAGRKYAGFF